LGGRQGGEEGGIGSRKTIPHCPKKSGGATRQKNTAKRRSWGRKKLVQRVLYVRRRTNLGRMGGKGLAGARGAKSGRKLLGRRGKRKRRL